MRWFFICGLVLATFVAGAHSKDSPDRKDQAVAIITDRKLTPILTTGVAFLMHASQRDYASACKDLKVDPAVAKTFEQGRVPELLRQMNLTAPFDISFIGFNFISNDATTLLYVTNTEKGPIGVKLSVYVYKDGNHLGRVEATDDWSELAAMAASVERLPAPLKFTAAATGAPTIDPRK
jgi:hypothetical protein